MLQCVAVYCSVLVVHLLAVYLLCLSSCHTYERVTPHARQVMFHEACQSEVSSSAARKTAMHHNVPHCNSLQHTATHCITLQHTATHCNTRVNQESAQVQHARQRCTHNAPHCNSLQHSATLSNTLQHACQSRVSASAARRLSRALDNSHFRSCPPAPSPYPLQASSQGTCGKREVPAICSLSSPNSACQTKCHVYV